MLVQSCGICSLATLSLVPLTLTQITWDFCLSTAQCLEHKSAITLLLQGLWQNIYFYHYYQFLVKHSRVNVQY